MKLFLILALVCVSLSATGHAFARSISFAGVDGKILTNIENHVAISRRLAAQDSLTEGEWLRLRRNVRAEIKEACEPYGYYQVSVERSSAAADTELVYQIKLGAPVIIDDVNLEIVGDALDQAEFQKWLADFPLKPGAILEQPVYESARKRLLAMARKFGYLDAQLTWHELIIDRSRTKADIRIRLDSGKRYRFGEINFGWAEVANVMSETSVDQYIRRDILGTMVSVTTGKGFDADAMSSTQRAITASSYFSSAEVFADYDAAIDQVIPLTITLTPRKRHAYNLVFGGGTDTGPRASAGYENRRINRRGHNLNARIGTSDIEQSLIVNYRIPRATSIDDSINVFAALEKEDTSARVFETDRLGVELSKKWGRSTVGLGLTGSKERFDSGTESRKSKLLMPHLSWERFVANDFYRPDSGWRASATVRGASRTLASDIDVVQLLLSARWLAKLYRGRLSARVQFSGSYLSSNSLLPASLGFLAGGDNSVRGYAFETIGVQQDDSVTFAENLFTTSLEYEHPLKNDFGLAVFFDAGDAFNDKLNLSRGAGVGLRWRLPFGALKLDVASALDLEGQPLRVHFNFGTDL